MKKIESLYIHIPFCTKICSYCDFPKVYHNLSLEREYVDALIKELHFRIKEPDSFKTVYIGGGNPLSLSDEVLEKLFVEIKKISSEIIEYSIESNPESLTSSKIELLKKYGINRVSIGVQSLSKNVLDTLGRKEISEQTLKNIITELKASKITDINLDFIYGVTGEVQSDIMKIIDFIREVDISHLSFYPLQLEENTLLYNSDYEEIDEDLLVEHYDLIKRELPKLEFKQYEVSNYYRIKKSLHNLTYWRNKEYQALGLGASRHINDTRSVNTMNIYQYILNPTETINVELLSEKEKMKEYIMLNLRLLDGFSILEYNDIFSTPFSVFSDVVDKLRTRGLIKLENNIVKTTENNIILLNQVLVLFFLEIEKRFN